jgi:hypothetical protein
MDPKSSALPLGPIPTLGKPIDLEEANREVNEYLDVRRKSYPVIQAALQGAEPEVVRHYADTEISFIFDKLCIARLLEIGGDTCNGIRVYYGAAPAGKTVDGEPIERGSTTMVLVPCKIEYDDPINPTTVTHIRNLMIENGDAAIEYPGGVIRDIGTMNFDLRTDNVVDPTAEIEHYF